MYRVLGLLFAGTFLLTVATPGIAQSGAPEKKDITLSVGGSISQMNKVAYAVALNKGFFQEEGLNVHSTAFDSGTRAMQSIVSGGADVAEGAYEHTIYLQKRGINLTCIVTFGRYPGNVLVVSKARASTIKAPADLKGKTIGVSAPGSSTQDFIAQILERAGVSWKDAKYVSVGTGVSAVAAMQNGDELDALVNLDPAITNLVNAGKVSIMVDSRNAEGTQAAFGGPYLGDCLMAKTAFVKDNPRTSQAIANAVVHAMQWLKTASIDDIIKSLPPSYYKANEAEYRESLKNNIAAFQWDGIVTMEAAKNVFATIALLDPELKTGNIKLEPTFDNKFVEAALKKYKAADTQK